MCPRTFFVFPNGCVERSIQLSDEDAIWHCLNFIGLLVLVTGSRLP